MEEKIKELLANYPNKRVDFESKGHGEGWHTKWNGEDYDSYDFCIYEGSSWDVVGSEYYIVNSIFVDEDDYLCFDLSVFGWNDGNYWEGEVLKDVPLFDIEDRIHFDCQSDCLNEKLSLFAKIL